MFRKKRLGFTLVELLVVISIIMIMASMLLPALNRVREQTKSIQCKNNLRQNGIAFCQYGGDFSEIWPMYYYRVSGTARSWAAFLSGYKKYDWTSDYPSYISNLKTAACPKENYDAGIFAKGLMSDRSYGARGASSSTTDAAWSAVYGNTPDWEIRWNGTWLISLKCKNPSQWWVLADSWRIRNDVGGQCYIAGASPGNSVGGLNLAHLNHANVLFADGHADPVTWRDKRITGSGLQYVFFRGVLVPWSN